MSEPNEISGDSPRRSERSRQRRSAQKQLAERQQRQSRLRRLAVAVIVIAVIVIAAAIIYSRRPAAPPVVGDIQTFSNLSRDHTTDPVTYPQHPPVGGPHDPTWQNCGFYSSPVRNENAVHSLEHGAVWITYRPDLPQAQIDALRTLAENQTYILVSPMTDLPAPVVASAWGKQILLTAADDQRLTDFLRRFRQDPNAPEPGAPCTGGTSETT
jgi:hypothetical protein